MRLNQVLRQVGFNVLQQSGIAVTPEQFGLKTNSPLSFSSFLSTPGTTATQGLSLPEPPVAPEDPLDVEAQKSFNEALVAYNQQIQAYNQRLYSNMLVQFQQMQRQLLQANQQSAPSTTSASTSRYDDVSIGTGGIF